MIDPRLAQAVGLGVVGNFTGHLEQAGEAGDFAAVEVASPDAPKGLFAFYLPGGGRGPLYTWPVDDEELRLPSEPVDVQIEPELALVCTLLYASDQVIDVIPTGFAAFDDASIRAPRPRISLKKNWGPSSKGMARTVLPIDRFEPGGTLDRQRLTSFLVREGQVVPYGIDSAVRDYTCFYGTLREWIVDTIDRQRASGPLDDVAAMIEAAARPDTALICVGATRYTPAGERNWLRPGDEAVVVVYDETRYDAAAIEALVRAGRPGGAELSMLRQRVVAAD